MFILLLSLVTAFISPLTFGQTRFDTSGDTRVRTIQRTDSRLDLEYDLTLKASLDINGNITIHSLVQSGSHYWTPFDDLYDINNNDLTTDQKLYLKRLYLEKNMLDGDVNLKLGAIDPRKKLGSTNKLAGAGWMDGARIKVNTQFGDIYLTSAQIDPEHASVTKRLKDPALNYFEIALSKKIMDKILIDSGIEIYNNQTYISLATQYELEVISGKILKIIADSKMQTSDGSFKASIGVKNILAAFQKDPKINISAYYEYIHPNFDSQMNNLNSGMHRGYTGGAGILNVDCKASKKYGISIYSQLRVGDSYDDFRVEVGIKKTLFNSKKRKKRK